MASTRTSQSTKASAEQTKPADARHQARNMVMTLQDEICAGLEELDGHALFQENNWTRPKGGGGRTRVIREGRIFEQGGVNFSEVYGDALPPSILKQKPEAKGHPWYATGVSMVLHPRHPYIPTVHLNYRYFEAGPIWWFGGGADLTPFYPYLEDTRHFHRTHKKACDSISKDLYKDFKPWCDNYFYLKHRKEARGVGGIFYDYLTHESSIYKDSHSTNSVETDPDHQNSYCLSWNELLTLGLANGRAFLPAYAPIVNKRCKISYGDKERQFQLYRRGRYVEFNLVWDRGTIFGLQTDGNTESILMSMPPLARWEYNYSPEVGSHEQALTEIFLQKHDWLGDQSLDGRCKQFKFREHN